MKVLASNEHSRVKIDLVVMGQLMKEDNQIWFQYILPQPPTLKEKLKQTGMRFHVEKEEKKSTLNKMALVTKEGFLPKIENKLNYSSSKR